MLEQKIRFQTLNYEEKQFSTNFKKTVLTYYY